MQSSLFLCKKNLIAQQTIYFSTTYIKFARCHHHQYDLTLRTMKGEFGPVAGQNYEIQN